MIVATFIAVVLVSTILVEPRQSDPRVEVKVTQKHLVPVCLDGAPVREGVRDWRTAPGSHQLSFTMRNDPHQSVPGAEVNPGVAAVQVTLEAGHKYEVEVRAPATTFASRAWALGEWKPVVRDRTSDRIVSGEPDWVDTECKP
jgi:hypothetical protein